MLVGAIEGGGTKFLCSILSFDSDASTANSEAPAILRGARISTTDPEATLQTVVDFFINARIDGEALEGLGIGMFGPIECDTRNPRWGYLLNTPKRGWADVDIAPRLQRALNLPVRLETDVAAAALGEWKWGAGRGDHACTYVTVGTGIGAGSCVDGRVLRGSFHPEFGHIRVPKADGDTHFSGVCIHHGDCLEGLASGPAMAARWGTSAENLPKGHPAWDLEAEYLALAFSNLALSFAPDRIIVGGGIGLRDGLLVLVAQRMLALFGGYVAALSDAESLRRYVVRAKLGSEAGILGAALLGFYAAQSL